MPTNQDDEQQKKDSLVVKRGKKLARDQALKVAKKVGKVVVKGAAKAALAAGKALVGILAGVGAPFILVVIGVLIVIFLIFLASSMFFIDDPGSLDKEQQELRNHIIEAADQTVDMSRPEQIPYRVPHELIIAAMQIYDTDSKVSSEKASSELADSLRPIFKYETKIATVVTDTTVCDSAGGCSTSTSTAEYELELLVRVDAWDRIMIADVIPFTNVETASSTSSSTAEDGTTSTITTTITSTANSFRTVENVTMDYTLYDRELSKKPFKYELESKLSVEAIYEIVGGEIYYKEWLFGDSMTDFNGSIIPGAGIPVEYMQYYLEAAKKYNVDWYYIAAIHFIETKFSTHQPMISSVGAEGHMQFMPCTWVGWGYPGCGGNGYIDLADAIKHNPIIIKKYGGLGIDGDGDGIADPFNLKDAIFSAANYLNKSGFSKNIDGAIRSYNKSDKYVADVKAKATEFKDASEYIPNAGDIPELAPGSFMRPAIGSKTSQFGPRWGRMHYGVDIANSIGTPIVSIGDGVVTHAACFNPCTKAWGKYVKVMYNVGGKKYEALYGHFNTLAVSKGQTVKQGQLLGGMGNTGESTGPHLHFEIHPGGYRGSENSAVNPELLVPL